MFILHRGVIRHHSVTIVECTAVLGRDPTITRSTRQVRRTKDECRVVHLSAVASIRQLGTCSHDEVKVDVEEAVPERAGCPIHLVSG